MVEEVSEAKAARKSFSSKPLREGKNVAGRIDKNKIGDAVRGEFAGILPVAMRDGS
jgi:hypothetical protein